MRFVRLVQALFALCLLFVAHQSFAATTCTEWLGWKNYKSNLLSPDGRVIDAESPGKITVSEGQAYGLFFALVANDRKTFDKILTWTEDNLAQGDFTAHLPAWHWGQREDGNWGVLDPNPASDADLWIAYTLAQAGRLWKQRRYLVLSQLIAHRIMREEAARIPGLGLTLLPAPIGFTPTPDTWRLNPSYVPIQILRGLEVSDHESPWDEIAESAIKLITDSAPAGFSPDWTLFKTGKGFMPDQETQADGSYNAIRVYLWAGMLDAREPARPVMIEALKPMAQHIAAHGAPEHVDTVTAAVTGAAPAGFSAAFIPFLQASGASKATSEQLQQIRSHPASATAYYNQSLTLFGLGWYEGYYRFSKNGSLLPQWSKACAH